MSKPKSYHYKTFMILVVLLLLVLVGCSSQEESGTVDEPTASTPVQIETPTETETESQEQSEETALVETEEPETEVVESDDAATDENSATDLNPYIDDILVEYGVTQGSDTYNQVTFLFKPKNIMFLENYLSITDFKQSPKNTFNMSTVCPPEFSDYPRACLIIGAEGEIPDTFSLDIPIGQIQLIPDEGNFTNGPYVLEISRSELTLMEDYLLAIAPTPVPRPDIETAFDLTPYLLETRIDMESWDDIGYESYVHLVFDNTYVKGINQEPAGFPTSRSVEKFFTDSPGDLPIDVVETELDESLNQLSLDIWFGEDMSGPIVLLITPDELALNEEGGEEIGHNTGPFKIEITDTALLALDSEPVTSEGDTLPSPDTAVSGPPMDAETYLMTALPTALEITSAVDQITKLLRNPSADRLDWVAAMEPHAEAAQAGYESLTTLSPPSEFQQMHSTLLEGSNACAQGTGQIVSGIKGPDQAALDASGPLIKTCTEKMIQAIQLLEQILTGESATPAENTENNSASTGDQLPALSDAGDSPLFPIVKGRKWGFINQTGEVVIEPQFTGAYRFNFPTFVEGLEPVNVGKGANAQWGFIDKSSQFVIEPQFGDAKQFSEGLARVKIGEKYGYINPAGEIVIEPQFDGSGPFTDGAAYAKMGETFTFIDTTGQPLSDLRFDEIGWFSEGLAAVKTGNKWGFIDKSGQYVIEPQFDKVKGFSEGLAPVQSGNRVQYIDSTGQIILDPPIDGAGYYSLSEGLAAVEVGGKKGYIDRTGQMVIEPQFDTAWPFSEGLAGVETVGKHGYIDPTGRMVFQLEFDFPVDPKRALILGDFSDGLAMIKVDGKFGYVDRTGNFVWKPTE